MKKVGGAPWYRNAGHWAAAECNLVTTKALFQAGVDSAARDALGYSVADYARQDPVVWQKTEKYFKGGVFSQQGPGPSDDVHRILRKTILDCVNILKELDRTLIEDREWEKSNAIRPPQATLTEFLRHHVACLALALERLRYLCLDSQHQITRGLSPNQASAPDGSHHDNILADSCLCTMEVIRAPYLPEHGIWWNTCCICKHNLNETVFKCRSCQKVFFCHDCHSNYIKHGRTVPERYQALARLGKQVSPIRVALEPLRGNIKLLAESLAALPEVDEWVITAQSHFDKWNKMYTTCRGGDDVTISDLNPHPSTCPAGKNRSTRRVLPRRRWRNH